MRPGWGLLPWCCSLGGSCGSSTRSGRSATTARFRTISTPIFGRSLKTYGWIDLIVAAILIAASFLVLRRSQIARWFGVVAGAILAVSSVWLMPFYPIWSLMYIGMGILLIYALVAHGQPGRGKVELT
jgi:hypothetical protein